MRGRDQYLLEQTYDKMYESTSNRILIPRRAGEERLAKQRAVYQKYVQEYIKNGSKGDLDLRRAIDFTLPDGLTVDGKLSLFSSLITKLPNKLHVTGSLILSFSVLTELPNDIIVGGSLHMYQAKITTIPKSMTVIEEDVFADYSLLTNVPDGFTVKGHLSLNNTSIENLPTNLQVGEELSLKFTPLAKKYNAKALKQMFKGVKGKIVV